MLWAVWTARIRWAASWLTVAWLVATGGCAASHCHRTSPACLAPPHLPVGSSATAGGMAVDISAVPTVEAARAQSTWDKSGTDQRYEMTADACRTLAAAQASDANLLDQQAATWESARPPGRSAAQAATMACLLRDLACHARNQAARDALRAFYQLAETTQLQAWVDQSISELEHAVDDLRQFSARGIQLPVDESDLNRQLHTARTHREDLALAGAQLQGGLRRKWGLCAGDPLPIWPDGTVKVTTDPLDMTALVAAATCARRDLSALRRLVQLESTGDAMPLPAALATLHPAWAVLSQSDRDAPPKADQSQCLMQQRQQEVEEETRQAARRVESQLVRIAMAQRERERIRDHLSHQQARRGTDHVSSFDLAAARLEVHQTEMELTRAVYAWQTARVDLQAALGQLCP